MTQADATAVGLSIPAVPAPVAAIFAAPAAIPVTPAVVPTVPEVSGPVARNAEAATTTSMIPVSTAAVQPAAPPTMDPTATTQTANNVDKSLQDLSNVNEASTVAAPKRHTKRCHDVIDEKLIVGTKRACKLTEKKEMETLAIKGKMGDKDKAGNKGRKENKVSKCSR